MEHAAEALHFALSFLCSRLCFAVAVAVVVAVAVAVAVAVILSGGRSPQSKDPEGFHAATAAGTFQSIP